MDPLAERVAARHKQADEGHEALTFPDEDSLREYLKSHPRADPRNQTVKKPKHDDKVAPASKEEIEQAAKAVKNMHALLDHMIAEYHSGEDQKYVQNAGQQLPRLMEDFHHDVTLLTKGINSIPAGKERERAKKIDKEIDQAFEQINKDIGYRWKGKRFLPPQEAEKTLKKIKPLVDELDKLLAGQRALFANVDPIAPRVVERFVEATTPPPTPQDAAYDFLHKSKIGDLIMGMADEARKAHERFGMRDATEAMEHWFAGREDKKPAQVAARIYLTSEHGKKLLHTLVTGVGDALKKAGMKPVGFKDVGHAIITYMKG